VKSLQTTDDGRQVMAIVHLDQRSRWTKNQIKIKLEDFGVGDGNLKSLNRQNIQNQLWLPTWEKLMHCLGIVNFNKTYMSILWYHRFYCPMYLFVISINFTTIFL